MYNIFDIQKNHGGYAECKTSFYTECSVKAEGKPRSKNGKLFIDGMSFKIDQGPTISSDGEWFMIIDGLKYISNKSVPESCSDGKRNQEEAAVDCGGPNCAVCPTCSDSIRNQGEVDVDCGGPCKWCYKSFQFEVNAPFGYSQPNITPDSLRVTTNGDNLKIVTYGFNNVDLVFGLVDIGDYQLLAGTTLNHFTRVFYYESGSIKIAQIDRVARKFSGSFTFVGKDEMQYYAQADGVFSDLSY